MKKVKTTIFFVLIFITGMSLLLYPALSNYWNSFHASKAVTTYKEVTDSMSSDQNRELLSAARAYNSELGRTEQSYYLSDVQKLKYENVLNIDGHGMMGYLEIEAIDVALPIYHSTDESVLQTSVGHLEWTSLPIGGESTHCVLSGHRGLPSAKLFTDLDKMTTGDTFKLTVLNRTITYEVDNIQTVKPEQVEDLKIQEGKDLCTLFTCTPYGINTHRLLIQGHRVENQKEAVHIASEAARIEPIVVIPFVALPMLVISFAVMKHIDRKKEWEEGTAVEINNQK